MKFQRKIKIEKIENFLSKVIGRNFSLRIALKEAFEFYGVLFKTIYKKSLTREGLDQFFLKKNVVSINGITIICFLIECTLVALFFIKNILYGVLLLILLFFNVSLYFLLLGLDFIALLLLIVYIGGISVLFLFVIFLLDLRFDQKRYYKALVIGFSLLFISCFSYSSVFFFPFSTSVLKLEEPSFQDKNILYDLTYYFFFDNNTGFLILILVLFLAILLPIIINRKEQTNIRF